MNVSNCTIIHKKMQTLTVRAVWSRKKYIFYHLVSVRMNRAPKHIQICRHLRISVSLSQKFVLLAEELSSLTPLHSPSHLFCPFVSLLHYTALSLSCATFISACIPSLRHHRHPSEVASLLEADTTMQCNLDEQLNLLYMLTYTRNGTTDA